MRFWAQVFTALMCALFLAGCGETHTWRQKLVLEVETPNGLVTGSGIVEGEIHWFGKFESALGASASATSVTGAASFVDIAPGKVLFALSEWNDPGRAIQIFRNSPDESGKAVTARLETLRETRVVPPDLYPKFVTFADINDPKTVKLSDPANLAAVFGPGVSLRRVTLEITGEELSFGAVERLLPWLCPYARRGARLNGSNSASISGNELSNNIGTGEFSSGGCE